MTIKETYEVSDGPADLQWRVHFKENFPSWSNHGWDVLSKISFDAEETNRDWEGGVEFKCDCCDVGKALHEAIVPIIQKTRKECSDYGLQLGYLEAMTDLHIKFDLRGDGKTAKVSVQCENEVLEIISDHNSFYITDDHDEMLCFGNPEIVEDTDDYVILKFPKEC
jgi:hypothetical protein